MCSKLKTCNLHQLPQCHVGVFSCHCVSAHVRESFSRCRSSVAIVSMHVSVLCRSSAAIVSVHVSVQLPLCQRTCQAFVRIVCQYMCSDGGGSLEVRVSKTFFQNVFCHRIYGLQPWYRGNARSLSGFALFFLGALLRSSLPGDAPGTRGPRRGSFSRLNAIILATF